QPVRGGGTRLRDWHEILPAPPDPVRRRVIPLYRQADNAAHIASVRARRQAAFARGGTDAQSDAVFNRKRSAVRQLGVRARAVRRCSLAAPGAAAIEMPPAGHPLLAGPIPKPARLLCGF